MARFGKGMSVKIPEFLMSAVTFAVIAASMGWAMAEGTGDTAVGIALGVGIAAAITGASRRGHCGRKQAQ
jgi:hypothetical protein